MKRSSRSKKSDAWLTLYRVAFPLVFLLGLPFWLMRMVRRGGFREKFWERLGWISEEPKATRSPLWIHSISVGETFIALKLIRALQQEDPELPLILSVTTTTAMAVAKPHSAPGLRLIYNPVDFSFITRRVLRALRPSAIVFVEGLWPNLCREAGAAGVKTFWIPRISPRSERRYASMPAAAAALLGLPDCLLVQESADRSRLEKLGASPEKIRLTGSIKFDQASATVSPLPDGWESFRQARGISEKTPVVVAGSTFPGEERLFLEAIARVRESGTACVGVLVPRHVERAMELARELETAGFAVERWSKRTENPPLARPSAGILVDATGILKNWYALAAVAFVGKSLLAKGGQNPVEPLLEGAALVTGPHMENFASTMNDLRLARAVVEIDGVNPLAEAILKLLKNPQEMARMVSAGREAAAAHQGAAKRAACEILKSSPGI